MTFSRFKLVVRNLRFFRAANLAIVAGMAVATAVLAGALMVGDSVRGSLRDLAERRLDWVDHAMVAQRMTNASIADRLSALPAFKERFETVLPAITLRGSAATATTRPTTDPSEPSRRRVPGVWITALPRGARGIGKGAAWLNGELAEAMGSPAGGAVQFSLPIPDETPREATLSSRARRDIISVFEAPKSQLAPAGGFYDLFSLTGGQRSEKLAWVNLEELQETLERPGEANLMLVGAKKGNQSAEDAARLTGMLREVATLADYGAATIKSADKSQVAIISNSTFLHPAITAAAKDLAAEQNVPLARVSAYLINNVVRAEPERPRWPRRSESSAATGPSTAASATTRSTTGPTSAPATKPRVVAPVSPSTVREIHYAIAAGIDSIDGKALAENEIAVNQWTADRMGLQVGNLLRLDYFQRERNGDLSEVRSDRGGVQLVFKVVRILPMAGIGADPTLTPEFKGLTDSRSIADWRPPAGVNINKKLVTKEDEAYWDQYKAAPKLFISMEAAERLWEGPFGYAPNGNVTSLRIPAEKADAFLAQLPRKIDPAPLGMSFRPIKEQQVSAASGGTDFGMLFAGFSFFLLIAAVLLAAMLFRLSIEQRARQLGVLAACGLSPAKIRNLCLFEGFLLALAGGVVGVGAGIGYTALMIHGLKTWWVGAIGTTALALHVRPVTLGAGLGIGVVVAMIAVFWGTRKLARTRPAALLAGGVGREAWRLPRRARLSSTVITLAVLGAAALFAAGKFEKVDHMAAFLGGGALLLLGMLTIAWTALRPKHRFITSFSLVDLALKNATRNRARSILCIALIALASFIIITVSSMESSTPADLFDKKSGAGGYALIVRTDIPLMADLNTVEGRKLMMRQASAADPLWEKARFVMMRTWAGQDVSCLNITRPDSPTILAVPAALARQDRFTFASQLEPAGNPLTLLDRGGMRTEAVPIIADDETAKYILKLGLGQTIIIADAAGQPQKLKLVATLKGSIFQSELLMSEANFQRLFPSVSGFATVLVETAVYDMADVDRLLGETLNDENDQEKTDYSASIDSTADRIDAYHKVANTYLSTFRVLGSLGLMLGTIGLSIVLVRNLVERRAELALLSSLGIGPALRSRMVLTENVVLLMTGLIIGAGSALAGVIPLVRNSAHRVNVPALAIALSAVVAVGLAVLFVAVRFAGRKTTPAELRAE